MKTRSLCIIFAFAICITIGGVYAAWLYAETPLTAVHGHIGSFGIADASINNAKGTIAVSAAGAHLSIDQSAPNDYTAKLVADGTITVTFTPTQVFADSNQSLDEIVMKYKLVTTNTTPLDFVIIDSTTLFDKFDTTTETDITLTKDGSGNYVGTLDASALLNLIEINEFKLETYERHQTASGKMGLFGNIGIEISES